MFPNVSTKVTNALEMDLYFQGSKTNHVYINSFETEI